MSIRKYGRQLAATEKTDQVLSDDHMAILKALGDFTRASGIVISGCGCCGSPTATNVNIKCDIEEIRWDKETTQYYCGSNNITFFEDGTRWTTLPDELS